MISRRNFFTITILMATVLFLCMCINNVKDSWNDYAVNQYTETAENYPSKINMFLPGDTEEEDSAGQSAEASAEGKATVVRDKVICIGEETDLQVQIAEEWVTYTKRDIAKYPSLSALGDGSGAAEMMIIDSDCVDWESGRGIDTLMKYVETGIHLVFWNLPDVSVIESNSQARELLGIRKVQAEETTVTGLYLREGFLLGGETLYLEKESPEGDVYLPGSEAFPGERTFPWYLPASGTKVYMKGIPEGTSVKADDYPIVMWRKSFGTAYVFAVNGDFMEGLQGMGILSAMSAEMHSYEIYPVLNAKNIILAGYPSLADENAEEMNRIYSRSVKQVFQELLWPNISAVLEKHDFRATCLMTPQYDYTDDNLPDGKQLEYYLKIFKEKFAEVGLWGLSVSDTSVAEKLREDHDFFRDALGGYDVTSFYTGDMTEEEIQEALQEEMLASVRTVVRGYDARETIGFLTEDVTAQKVLGDGLKYTYKDNFLVKSIGTALGYFSMSFDMSKVAYPEADEDAWEELSKALGTTISTYGKEFQAFEGTTASECDLRIRRFLALDFSDSRADDTVRLEVEGVTGPVWFILRTHNEAIREMEGGSWQELEKDVYLIEARESQVTLTLEPNDKRFYR